MAGVIEKDSELHKLHLAQLEVEKQQASEVKVEVKTETKLPTRKTETK